MNSVSDCNITEVDPEKIHARLNLSPAQADFIYRVKMPAGYESNFSYGGGCIKGINTTLIVLLSARISGYASRDNATRSDKTLATRLVRLLHEAYNVETTRAQIARTRDIATLRKYAACIDQKANYQIVVEADKHTSRGMLKVRAYDADVDLNEKNAWAQESVEIYMHFTVIDGVIGGEYSTDIWMEENVFSHVDGAIEHAKSIIAERAAKTEAFKYFRAVEAIAALEAAGLALVNA